jgi:hypothetical protein
LIAVGFGTELTDAAPSADGTETKNNAPSTTIDADRYMVAMILSL